MHCIVTAGPTFEPLDEVRRLTNFSTGRFGSLLANFLVERGHQVTLLLGHYATYNGEQKAQHIETFTTTENLREKLKEHSAKNISAVFHAAAVSDFGFGKVYERTANGETVELKAGKIPTRSGKLLAELVPTAKIISELRGWFPQAKIVGWKYEVDQDRPSVLRKAEQQIADNKTDACVANGPAYGFGFGLVRGEEHLHFSDTATLFHALEDFSREPD
jgi:phosphopantothenoylcysteine decarboxylase/phosphopantothenate--cysteine ligase